jgi:hypothetical protein
MNRIFSNRGQLDFVLNPFEKLADSSERLLLAAPYFTKAGLITGAAQAGKVIQLLVGLNKSTSPAALAHCRDLKNVNIRYLTRRFRAKIFIFDNAALLGSSNLTDAGFLENREAVIRLDGDDDADAIDEVRSLFLELWESARVLTDTVLKDFKLAWESTKRPGPDPDNVIEERVGIAEPKNIAVTSHKKTKERLFVDELQRQVIEQYQPAFREVTALLEKHHLRRPELEGIGQLNETNRFLNWVRLTHVIGDEKWQLAAIRTELDRRDQIISCGKEWATTGRSEIPSSYIEWLRTVQKVFGTKSSIGAAASKEEITRGLMSLHAFDEQLRFVKGGRDCLPLAFWDANANDVERVKKSLTHLVHGTGDFVPRLHDFLYAADLKLRYFGYFCALELMGTVKPEVCPPVNGRMGKALRFRGFDVRAQ